MEKLINVVSGAKISIEQTENGSVIKIVESEKEKEFKVGDYVKWNSPIDSGLGIVTRSDIALPGCYNCFMIESRGCISNNIYLSNNLHPANEDEKRAVDGRLKAIDKRWNPETQQVEDVVWYPKDGEEYFCIGSDGFICKFTYSGYPCDIVRNEIGNSFKTEEDAIPFQEPFRKLFKK